MRPIQKLFSPARRYARERKGAAAVEFALVVTLLYTSAFAAAESTFGLWAQHRFGWQAHDIGICFGITGIVAAFSQFLITGPLSRRYGEANMLAAGMAGTALCTAAMPFTGWASTSLPVEP